jgi:hypothetical protein
MIEYSKMTRTELFEMMLKEIREARENASTPEDFRIERRLIEDKYEALMSNARD